MTTCYGQNPHGLVAGPFFVSETVHRPGLVLQKHEHATYCFHSVLKGEYSETTSRQEVHIDPRQSLLKPPEIPHWNRFGKLGSRTLRIEFQQGDPRFSTLSHLDALIATTNPIAFDLAQRMLWEIRTPDPLTTMVVEGLCLELMTLMLRDAVRPARRERLFRRVAACTEFLRSSFQQSFTLSDLSKLLEVNRTQLATAFRQVHGITMGEYLRRVRIDHVREQLDSTDRPLARIAHSAGFSDQSHCTRTFKRVTGVTPAAWRAARRHRQASNS